MTQTAYLTGEYLEPSYLPLERLPKELKAELEEHATQNAPHEACGYLTNTGYIPCQNIHETPTKAFRCDPEFSKVADGQGIIGIFHSHTNGNTRPTVSDLVSCERSGVPWYLFVLPQQTWLEFTPSGYQAPLLGRPWDYPLLDCYSVIRDAYKQLGIFLSDFERAPLFAWNTDPSWNQYIDNMEAEGFHQVTCPQRYDLLLMNARSKKPNHSGLYLGDGLFLHHPINSLSEVRQYDGYWKKCTTSIWRHKDIGDAWITKDLKLS